MKKFYLPLVLLFHLLFLSQITFTAWPEMLSYPYLFIHSFTLYKDFILPYPPLLVMVLSVVFKVFGFQIQVLQILTWTLILVGDFLLYKILRQLVSNGWAILLLIIYALLQTGLDGNQLWFDFALVVPLLCSYWFINKNKIFWAGVALGLALLVKQTAIIYFLLLPIFFRDIKKIVKLYLGGIIVGLPFIVYLLATSSLRDFWLWSILYPVTEWSKFPGYVALQISRIDELILFLLFLPVLFIRDKRVFLPIIFLISAVLSVYPRITHFHLQPVLPFLVIIYSTVKEKWPVFIITSIFVAGLTLPQILNNQIRFYDNRDLTLINQMEKLSNKDDKVFLLGFNSANYIYADRVPPKHWSDNFGWYLEIPGVQDWVIDGFKDQPPKVIFVKTPDPGNWYDLGTYQPKQIMNFIKQNYRNTDNINNIQIWLKKG